MDWQWNCVGPGGDTCSDGLPLALLELLPAAAAVASHGSGHGHGIHSTEPSQPQQQHGSQNLAAGHGHDVDFSLQSANLRLLVA